MDIQLFENFDEDGQLSMFDMVDELESRPGAENSAEEKESNRSVKNIPEKNSVIRIQKCSTCGKMLFVREDEKSYFANCNRCGIEYLQKK